MIARHDLDPAGCYEQLRAEMIDVVRSIDDVELGRPVPATPAWTVHDVLAHVVGVTSDLNHQRFGAGDPDGWTAAQVTERSGWSVPDLVAEWDREATPFVDGLRLFGYGFACHFTADLLHHLADVQHALGRRHPPEDAPPVIAAVDFALDTCHEGLLAADLGPVVWTIDDESFTLGRTGADRRPLAVRSSRWDAARSIGGRRTRHQIAALDWSGDPAGVLDHVSCYPPPTAPVEPMEPSRP